MKKILLSLIFCLFVNNFYTHTEEWTVLNTSNSDIPFDEITSILQISNGNLYVGSDSSSLGIFSEIFAFYDGKNWVYISPWNPPSSINYTIKFEGILQASNGDVYASVQTMYSSENCGLARYTGHQWIIYDTSNSGLPLCSINSIVESNDGDIYIGTRLKGVIKFDGINWTIFNSSNSGLPDSEITSLLEAQNGDIYIGTRDSGLVKYDGENWTVYNSSNSGLPGNNIQTMVETKNKNIYLGTYGDGLVKFDGTNWTVYNTSNSGLPSNYINAILQTKNEDIYIATKSSGLVKFDGTDWTVYNTSNSGLPSNYMSGLTQARNGDLLIGTWSGLAIFTPNDAPGNDVIKTLKGTVYLDKNNDGIKNFNEIGLKYQKVKLSPDGLYTYTNTNGEFAFQVDSGSYDISCIPADNWHLTSNPVTYSVEFDSLSIDTLDFGVHGIQDTTKLITQLTMAPTRCGFTINGSLNTWNDGTRSENILISLTPDQSIKLENSFPASDSVSPDSSTYFWHQSLIPPFEHRQIQLRLRMPGVNSMGNTMISYAKISNDSGYVYIDTLKTVLTCSYDPNDKLVEPAGTGEENYTLMDQELTYTVRFQNTGTDTAFNIIIRDTLDANLDMSTFTVDASSHDVSTLFDTTGVVSFTFNNIMLPDSNENEPASHGYVTFTVSPKPGLSSNTVVNNTAFIYFDFNPAIVTNETQNTYVTEVPVKITKSIIPASNDIQVSPNPFKEQAVMSFSNPDQNMHALQLFDVNGKMVKEYQTTGTQIIINKEHVIPGAYIYRLRNLRSGEIHSGKLILQ